MDISTFKASRMRLIAWIVAPPLLGVGIGLSAYALQRRSHWELNRTQVLSGVLPKLVQTQREADDLLAQFQGLGDDAIQSEDQMISFLQQAAQRAGFTVDSVKVERRISAEHQNLPVLTATMKGWGNYDQIERFLGDVTTEQYLLSESSVKLSQSQTQAQSLSFDLNSYQAELSFELLLFDKMNAVGGSKKQ